uniref:hypothetical protein n=1 Tax=Klebsiella pneumoniae TaxID=573 RepID=UPI00117ABDC2
MAKDLAIPIILGADFIQQSGMVMDLQNHLCYFKFNRSVQVPFLGSSIGHSKILEVECETETSQSDPLAHLPLSQAKAIRDLCSHYPEVLTPELGLTHLLEYEISLTDKSPVRSHPYKLAPPKMEVLREMIDDLLQKGVIEPSRSSYASPAFLVPKPNGKSRMVID